MSETVWLINQDGSVPEFGNGGRVFYLAKYLSKMGFKVYFIVARNHHLLRAGKSNPRMEIIDGVNVISIATLNYDRSNSWKRVLNWFIFNFLLLFVNLKIRRKPRFILASSPSPFVGLSLLLLSKMYSSKSCFDVRDVWPATLSVLGNVSKSSFAFKLMSWVEKISLKYTDIITSNLPNFSKRVEEVLGWSKKCVWLPNGYDNAEMLNTEFIKSKINDNIPKEKFVVGYVGSIGRANALEYLLEAANLIRNPRVHFVIVGDGEKLEVLKSYAQAEALKNITFFPKIDKKQVPSVLRRFDVCYIGWRDSELYDYGIAPNKIPEYLISEKPVLHSFSGPNDPIAEAGAGVSVDAEDPIAIAAAIESLEATSISELHLMGTRGKQYALNYYCYEAIAKKLVYEVIT